MTLPSNEGGKRRGANHPDKHQFVGQLSKTDKHIKIYPEGIP